VFKGACAITTLSFLVQKIKNFIVRTSTMKKKYVPAKSRWLSVNSLQIHRTEGVKPIATAYNWPQQGPQTPNE